MAVNYYNSNELNMDSFNQELTEDQRLMKQSCRDFIDE
ncbi:MAG: hypothetical protein Ct9H300mP28_33250 [Pseudomonadota bacterium]|nr:MAG: hypothetical protein Ct9H300mP28_33250 [Pseudomonadota bacterium]